MIIDTVTFNRPEAFESALITFEPWEQLDKNRLCIGQDKDDNVTRLALVLTRPVKKATHKIEIRPWEP